MDDAKAAYVQDTRIPCRYGRKCFQKNPLHHNKYKHPPDPKRKKIFNTIENETKKIKLNGDTNHHRDEPNKVDVQGSFQNNSEILNEGSNTDGNKTEVSAIEISNDVSDSDSEIANESVDTVIDKETGDLLLQEKDVTFMPNDSSGTTVSTSEKKGDTNFNRKFIKDKFLFDMPEDFYNFFKFCQNLNSKNPSEALSSVGLRLVGPYDVLSGKFAGVDVKDDDFLIHWRYFYDPPQMQTILKGDDRTGYHIGYFRDSPSENPVFMVENYGLRNGILTKIGDNIFAAVSVYLEEKKKTADPFNKVHFVRISNMLKKEAEILGLDLSSKTKNMTKRDNNIVSRTFNKVGLVVPYNRKSQLGYRKLAVSDKQLETLLTNIQKAHQEQKQKLLGDLQSEILTWTDIACDECDFGTGIELGWNIICHGVKDLNNTAARFLASNYRQLKWDNFAKIAEVHMAHRKEGCDLSII